RQHAVLSRRIGAGPDRNRVAGAAALWRPQLDGVLDRITRTVSDAGAGRSCVLAPGGATRRQPRDFQGGAAVGDARHRSGCHSRPARQGCVLDAGPDVGAFAAAVVRAHVLLRRGALVTVAQARRGAAGARAANLAVGTVRLRSLADNQRDTLDRTVQCRNGLSEGSPI